MPLVSVNNLHLLNLVITVTISESLTLNLYPIFTLHYFTHHQGTWLTQWRRSSRKKEKEKEHSQTSYVHFWQGQKLAEGEIWWPRGLAPGRGTKPQSGSVDSECKGRKSLAQKAYLRACLLWKLDTVCSQILMGQLYLREHQSSSWGRPRWSSSPWWFLGTGEALEKSPGIWLSSQGRSKEGKDS